MMDSIGARVSSLLRKGGDMSTQVGTPNTIRISTLLTDRESNLHTSAKLLTGNIRYYALQ